MSYYEKNAQKVLQFAYDKGIRDFDTAPSYGKGEKFLLDWYKQGHIQDLSLSTKWGYTYVADWEIGYSNSHEIKEHSETVLKRQWQESSDLLQPYLDLYQIHSVIYFLVMCEKRMIYLKFTPLLPIVTS